MARRLCVVVALVLLAGCGGGPAYSDKDLDDAYGPCLVEVAVNGAGTYSGPNAAIVGCLQEKVSGLGFDDAKAYVREREDNAKWLEGGPS